MARGPKTSLLTMLSGGISRLKTTIYTGFAKNHLGTFCETAHKIHRRTFARLAYGAAGGSPVNLTGFSAGEKKIIAKVVALLAGRLRLSK
jgi:hypothetical protein